MVQKVPFRPYPAVVALMLSVGLSGPAAAFFSDDEARKAILELRQRQETQRLANEAALARANEELTQLRRSLLDLQSQIDALRGETASLRGQNEQLARDLSEAQRRQKDLAQATDEKLRRFEPVKVALDGRDLMVDPAEKKDFDAAMTVFKSGNYGAAQAAMLSFVRRYPTTPYRPWALFWLGNAQYATREYTEAVSNFRALIGEFTDHPRVPETLLAIANCQIELKDNRAARRTLDDLVKNHPQTEAAQAARERLARLR